MSFYQKPLPRMRLVVRVFTMDNVDIDTFSQSPMAFH